jgi:hypothetical protein
MEEKKEKTFKGQLAKLIDVKSIVTIALVFTLVFVVVSGRPVEEKILLLFSNCVTSIITYFFTKKDQQKAE